MSTALAVYGDLTVFSCQYRLGPETKVPGGILDAYAAVNYITQNAEQFNIDPERIGIWGNSGGGFIASGCTYELAKNDKSHLVKIVYLDVPNFFGDYWWNENFEFNDIERNLRPQQLGCFTLLTGLDRKDPDNPYHFSPSMGETLLSKLPNHICSLLSLRLSCFHTSFSSDSLPFTYQAYLCMPVS